MFISLNAKPYFGLKNVFHEQRYCLCNSLRPGPINDYGPQYKGKETLFMFNQASGLLALGKLEYSQKTKNITKNMILI